MFSICFTFYFCLQHQKNQKLNQVTSFEIIVRYCVEYLYSLITMGLKLYLAVYGRICVILYNRDLLINMRGGMLL
jgi:hypothetical protein